MYIVFWSHKFVELTIVCALSLQKYHLHFELKMKYAENLHKSIQNKTK